MTCKLYCKWFTNHTETLALVVSNWFDCVSLVATRAWHLVVSNKIPYRSLDTADLLLDTIACSFDLVHVIYDRWLLLLVLCATCANLDVHWTLSTEAFMLSRWVCSMSASLCADKSESSLAMPRYCSFVRQSATVHWPALCVVTPSEYCIPRHREGPSRFESN